MAIETTTILTGVKAPRKSRSRLKLFFNEQDVLMTLLKEFRDGILICDDTSQILQVNDSLKATLHLTDTVIGHSVNTVIRHDTFQTLLTQVLESGNSEVQEITLISLSREMFFEIHFVPILTSAHATRQALAKAGILATTGTHADAAPLYEPPSNRPDEPSQSEALTDAHKADTADEPAETVVDVSRLPDGCVIIFHDITDIRRTEIMRRDFVANVSHELRTPLTAIEGYAETLLEGALEDQAVCRDFVQVIHRHSLRLTQLVHDLLDLSKLESPDYKPEFMPVTLTGLIQQAFIMVQDKALEKEITISVEVDDRLARVMAEFSSMQQVMTNLFDNAIKYTPNAGIVTVRGHLNAQGVVQVDVTDNGLGIESKYLPRIFERFYRVDKARSRDLGGTGLGLSIVKHIVQLHGGEIWVESEPNKGSTFSFTLTPEML